MNYLKSPFSLFCLLTVMFFASQVLAAPATGKIYGFAWGGNNNDNGLNCDSNNDGKSEGGTGCPVAGTLMPSSIGWISFSSKNCDTNGDGKITAADNAPVGCPPVQTPAITVGQYGVTMTDDGNGTKAILDGYAWSDSLGWISFKAADLSGCDSTPCKAWVDTTCPSGKCGLYGWAKVISVNAGNNGGWDGFVHLNYSGNCDDGTGKSTGATGCLATGTTVYGAYFDQGSGNLMGYLNSKHNGMSDGYAASNYDVTTGTIGWIRLTGNGAHTDFPFVPSVTKPLAVMTCDSTGCLDSGNKVKCDNAACDSSGNNCSGSWVMYTPIANPACNFQLKNLSTNTSDPTTTSTWTIGVAQTIFSGKHDYGTVQANLAPNSYTVSLKMENSAGATTATHSLTILNDVHAGFMCSLDGVVWQVCSSPNLAKSITKNEKIYFKDNQAIATGNNYSWSSDSANLTSGSASREWTLNGVSIDPVDPVTHVKNTNAIETFGTMDQKTNTFTLLVTDSVGRTDHVSYSLNANLTPPIWREISPIGSAWKNLLAGVFGVINSVPR